MKKILTIFLCGIMLLCFAACGKNTNSNIQSAESTNQSKINSSENPITNTQPTEGTNQNDTNNQATAIFNTKNIKRITFYAYYGNGKGSDVPVEHLDEIITWLDSFEVDTNRKFPDLIPPGTNTILVEIEYSDGSIVKQGMDTTVINGITYYISGAPSPECYNEIISKTSLS
ncbi:MAG: hypothetical protein E7574_05330 [Ruminococcaceae bacterium]|nr:hypothetical protein [Oscillospiraceae bacterium]